jgi:hypothetical protein
MRPERTTKDAPPSSLQGILKKPEGVYDPLPGALQISSHAAPAPSLRLPRPAGEGAHRTPGSPPVTPTSKKSPIWGMRVSARGCYRSHSRNPAEGNEADG